MKQIMVMLILLITGCTNLTVETADGTIAKYTSVDFFRLRNSSIKYNPQTKEFEANITRQQSVSPELIDAAVKAGVTAARTVQ